MSLRDLQNLSELLPRQPAYPPFDNNLPMSAGALNRPGLKFLDEVLIASITGWNPGWFLSIYDQDKIDLPHAIGMAEVYKALDILRLNRMINHRVFE